MRVTSLFVYPVKSCRGIAIQRARLSRRGFDHDRRWMIVDESGVFITQREEPRLARVAVSIEDDAIILSAPGHGEVRVRATPPGDGPRRRVRVWKSEVDAVDCGEPVAAFLTSWLARSARLVFMPDDVERQVSLEYGHPGDIVGFADGYPLLLTTSASLDDLSTRLEQAGGADAAVPMDRFRPNVVVSGSTPWEEDTWARVQIGDVPMRIAKPCDRCTIVTVDQSTGQRTGAEPLRTLASFRQAGSVVLFGYKLIPDAEGSLAVGSELRVLAAKGGVTRPAKTE